MTSIEKTICYLVIQAQMWSDSAKGIISSLEGSEYNTRNYPKYYCYYKKDYCIIKAINLINNNKRCCISYYVDKDEALNSALVYFEIHEGKLKTQISFHSFQRMLKVKIGAGKPMRWKGVVGSSRQAAEELQKIVKEYQGNRAFTGDNM